MMNNELQHHIILFGDRFLCKNTIIALKKTFSSANDWLELFADEDSLDKIKAEICTQGLDEKNKIVLISNIPNKKQVREFLISLFSECPSFTKIILWDSNGYIELNSDGTYDKTWNDFLLKIRTIKGIRIINHGNNLEEKPDSKENAINFIIECFSKYSKIIEEDAIKVLIDIVGYDRGLLSSDIERMCLIAPDYIDVKFILDNAFPTSKESVLYKFSNILDTASYEASIYMMDRFLASGINENVLAEIIMKKARWQLAATYLWAIHKLSWDKVLQKIKEMGRYPSYIWNNPKIDTQTKRKESEQYQDFEKFKNYLIINKGIPSKYFVGTEKNKSENINQEFWAKQIIDFIQTKIIKSDSCDNERAIKIYNRALKVYLQCFDKLCDIRYGSNPSHDLQEMIKFITDTRID